MRKECQHLFGTRSRIFYSLKGKYNYMDKNLLQKYINENLSSYKIAKLENVSPAKVKYWLKKHGIKSKVKYTLEDIRHFLPETKSIAELLSRLNLKPCGGNYYTIKRILQEENLDTTHWTGQGWSKDQQLKDWSNYTASRSIRKILIKERGNQCEKCGITNWLGIPLGIEMHHIDGDRTNNDKTNLVLLCPNCHSITDNFKNRKRL